MSTDWQHGWLETESQIKESVKDNLLMRGCEDWRDCMDN